MRKIAIIMTKDIDTYYNIESLIVGISDWAEVTDEEYRALIAAQHNQSWRIIERPCDERQFIENTVASYLKKAQELEETRRREKQAREDRAEKRALNKLAKDEKKKRELYDQLKAELKISD